jgi:hypothetical protein
MIFVIHGTLSIYYIPISDNNAEYFASSPISSSTSSCAPPLIKTLTSGDFSVLHDHSIDLFSTKRRYRMLLKASTRCETITISQAKLVSLLALPNFEQLKGFLQMRQSSLPPILLHPSHT